MEVPEVKAKRHAKILEIIRKYDVDTQEELCVRLNEAGYKVTQATVSRDIRELKLTKVAIKGGKQKYTSLYDAGQDLEEKYRRVFKDGVISLDMAQNILVIKTVSGMAMAVCAAIDSLKWNEVVGSIAGDDTIMCVIRSTDDAVKIMDKISKIVL